MAVLFQPPSPLHPPPPRFTPVPTVDCRTALLIWLNVHSNLFRLIREGRRGGMGTNVLPPTRYSHHQNDCVKLGSCVRHFNVSLILWAKSKDERSKTTISEDKGEPKGIEPRSFCLPA